jgi:hypothetical protein
MICREFLLADKPVQAGILSRILLMKGCRFDQNSIIQRIAIDTGVKLEPSDLEEIETRLGMRAPAWVRLRHHLEMELQVPPQRLTFIEKLLPGSPAVAGLRFGELLWEFGYREIPANISSAWPAFRLILNSAAKVALVVKAGGATTRMDVIRLASTATTRLDAIEMTPLQVADLLMPSIEEANPDVTELLVRMRGQKPKWHIPRGTRLAKVPTSA